eukprot:scaffold10786_cov61-Phaeocystis_antarctica.AAC.3
MQSRCSTSSTLASRPLPSLEPPRHTCRWTSPSTATAGRGCWLRKLILDSLTQLVTSCIRLANSGWTTCKSAARACQIGNEDPGCKTMQTKQSSRLSLL